MPEEKTDDISELLQLFYDLRLKGAQFITDGVQNLRVKAPAGVIDKTTREYLSINKPRMITLLQRRALVLGFAATLLETSVVCGVTVPAEFWDMLEAKMEEVVRGLIPFEDVQLIWSNFIAEQTGAAPMEQVTL